jgi:hypothetical protein
MRLTVGQLPPSVYWRRRAVVAAGVLVVVLIVAFSCSGDEDPGKKETANPASTGNPTSASPTPSQPASVITPNASDPSTGQPAGNQGGGATGAGTTGENCADSELLVSAAADNATVRQGVPTTFYILVKNTSTRLCSRDLSAQAQELYLEQNQAKQWSSDACGNSPNSGDVRPMQPNIEFKFNTVWNGQGTAQGCTNRQFLKAGAYQLRARLGNIISEPVTVTVTQ